MSFNSDIQRNYVKLYYLKSSMSAITIQKISLKGNKGRGGGNHLLALPSPSTQILSKRKKVRPIHTVTNK